MNKITAALYGVYRMLSENDIPPDCASYNKSSQRIEIDFTGLDIDDKIKAKVAANAEYIRREFFDAGETVDGADIA